MAYSTIEETHFIEDIGLYFERLGLPRMAGRILGVLLISDPPAQSITEIVEKLNASKSSISIMARLLVEAGLIEKVPSPMPRRDYFKFKTGGWILYMQQWFELMSGLHKITERGIALLNDKPADLKNRLMEAHDLFSYLEEHFPTLLEKLRNGHVLKQSL
jgi:DNA-binding transcriptional regulator GbsR (MarR family)